MQRKWLQFHSEIIVHSFSNIPEWQHTMPTSPSCCRARNKQRPCMYNIANASISEGLSFYEAVSVTLEVKEVLKKY